MKRGTLVGMILITLILWHAGAWAAPATKFGVLNMQRFQEKSTRFQGLREEMRKKTAKLEDQLEKEKQDVLRLEDELRKQSMMLSLDAKEDKQKELAKKTRHYKFMYDEFIQEMKEMEGEATRRLEDQIQGVVDKIGKRDGYTLILDTRLLGLLYYDQQVEVTDEVIKGFDALKP